MADTAQAPEPTPEPTTEQPTSGLVRCHHAFVAPAPPGGTHNRVIRVGDVLPADDPIVQGRLGAYFEPVEQAAERARIVVEQATSAPGERRGGRRKKKGES